MLPAYKTGGFVRIQDSLASKRSFGIVYGKLIKLYRKENSVALPVLPKS